jgi:hypothetical protein
MAQYRSRRLSLAIYFPGLIGDIPRKPGVQRRSADDLSLKVLANYDSFARMTSPVVPLPTDLTAAHVMIIARSAPPEWKPRPLQPGLRL